MYDVGQYFSILYKKAVFQKDACKDELVLKISQQHVIGLDLVYTSISLSSAHSCWTKAKALKFSANEIVGGQGKVID